MKVVVLLLLCTLVAASQAGNYGVGGFVNPLFRPFGVFPGAIGTGVLPFAGAFPYNLGFGNGFLGFPLGGALFG